MNNKRIWALGLLTLSISQAVYAVDGVMPDMLVTAAKLDTLPNSTVLKSSELSLTRTSDTASLSGDIPGVSLYGAGGVSSLPAIHGMADDRINVQVDGMNLMTACPNHMNSPLSYIDPSNVASVKVYAGITPVSIGGDSIGGSILVKSAQPVFAVQGILNTGELGAFYRSNGNAYGANVNATVAGDYLSLSYSGSTAQSGDYHAAQNFKSTLATGRPSQTLPLDVVGSSAYKSENQTLKFALRQENKLFELSANVQNTNVEGFPNQRMDMTGNNNTSFNFHYTAQYDWGMLESSVYHQQTEHSMNFGDDRQFMYGNAPGMPMNTSGKTNGVVLKGDVVLSERDVLRVGAEVKNYRLNDWWPASGTGLMMAPYTFQNINNGTRDQFDLFGEWEAHWNPQWMSLLGVRSDTVKMNTDAVQGYSSMYTADANKFNTLNHAHTDHNWDMTALTRYTPDSTQSYEFGYAQKSRSANLDQLYTWSTNSMAAIMNNLVGDGNGYVGNNNLKPEVAHTLSMTANWHDTDKWAAILTPYYTYIDNYIDAQCLPGMSCKKNQFNVLQYVNQSAQIYGVDLSGHYNLGKSGSYGEFTAKGILSYIRGKNLTTGDKLYNIMPLNAKLSLEQRAGSFVNTAEVQLVAAKTEVSQVRNEVKTGGYTLFNLRSSYQLNTKTRIDFGIDNLFNKFYSLPLGGIYIGQGKTMSANAIGIPYGIAVPGAARSIYTGLTVKF
jgi:iron complex outermembrane receptor protein